MILKEGGGGHPIHFVCLSIKINMKTVLTRKKGEGAGGHCPSWQDGWTCPSVLLNKTIPSDFCLKGSLNRK